MKKVSKIYVTVPLFLTSAVLLAGCPKKAGDLLMWTGFGSSYSIALRDVLDQHTAATGVTIEHESQSGYDNLQNNMNNSIATLSYPNIANGYPDHFAGYIRNEIQVPLDDYIAAYNEEHGVDLLSDFYPEYLKENQELAYDDAGNKITYGLPFNKSTEVLGYNNYFVQLAIAQDPSIAAIGNHGIPVTWEDVRALGPKYRAVMAPLAQVDKDHPGKWIYGKINPDDPNLIIPTETEIVTGIKDEKPEDHIPEGKVLLLDCSKVDMDYFRVCSWDAAENMFITIVRQWGGEYTSFTKADMAIGHGWAKYCDGDNKAKTKAALQYFEDLYADKTFGLPSDLSATASYSSDAFLVNQCIFTVCSSGGLSYNIKEGWGRRFRPAPIPYLDADHKFVISQGTNLAVFDQGNDATKQKAFDTIVALCTGELQSQWAAETGYYPASKSAIAEGTPYYKLMHEPAATDVKAAYQESAHINEENYMKDSEHWTKFVDPGFTGSSIIRKEVGTLPGIVFLNYVLRNSEKQADRDRALTIDQILDQSYARIKDYVKK